MATGMPDATDPSTATAPGAPPRMSLSRLRRGNDLFAVLVTAVLVGLGLFLVAWSAPVLGPLGLGLFLAGLAAPLFGWLEHRGRSAPLALAITIAVLVVAGGAIVLLGLTAAQTLTSSLDTYAADIQARYDDPAFPATLRELIPPDVLVGILRTVTGILVQVGSSLIFAMVIAALFLLDGPRLARLVSGGLGSENPVFRETPGLARAAVTYFLVRVRINAVTAVSLLVLMLLVGVDHALLWAVGVFVLSFVPYLGLIVALIPPTILAFAESGLPAALVDRARRDHPQRRGREHPRADAHRARAVAHDLGRVRDVLPVGLAAGAGRRAAVDADHPARRPGPRPRRAHPLGRRPAHPQAGAVTGASRLSR